jgi:hypothetical protein
VSDDDAQSYCPTVHRDETPRKSARGTVLCGGCLGRLQRTLEELSTFDADADQAALDSKLARHDGAPLTGTGERPLPIDSRKTYDWERVTIANAPKTLAGWCRIVAEERHLSPPHLTEPPQIIAGPLCTGCGHGSCRQIDRSYQPRSKNALKVLCGFLTKHLDWVTAQDWVDEFARETCELGGKAAAILRPSGNRQFPVGECIEQVDGERCTGTMWALLTPSDSNYIAAAELACDSCPARVESADWLVYGHRLRKGQAA